MHCAKIIFKTVRVMQDDLFVDPVGEFQYMFADNKKRLKNPVNSTSGNLS